MGAVEQRILDAARKVFLESGFAGTSIDEIAEVARSGKPTIYARFSGKEALFKAVVMRSVAANVAHFDNYTPTGANIEERLESIAATVLEWILLSGSGDRGGAPISRFGQQRLRDGARAQRPSRSAAFGGGGTIRRVYFIGGGIRARAPDNHDAYVPGFGHLAIGDPSIVRREAQAAACGDRTACEPERCEFSCRLPAWWCHLKWPFALLASFET